MDNRLDYIDKFVDQKLANEEMTFMRKKFIDLDTILRIEGEFAQIDSNMAMERAITIARTRIEEALNYTIKALCLKHEQKP